jgi:hypothetical protein
LWHRANLLALWHIPAGQESRGVGLNILYLVGSLAGVALMVGLNLALFGRGAQKIVLDKVSESLTAEVPGFRAGASICSSD